MGIVMWWVRDCIGLCVCALIIVYYSLGWYSREHYHIGMCCNVAWNAAGLWWLFTGRYYVGVSIAGGCIVYHGGVDTIVYYLRVQCFNILYELRCLFACVCVC